MKKVTHFVLLLGKITYMTLAQVKELMEDLQDKIDERNYYNQLLDEAVENRQMTRIQTYYVVLDEYNGIIEDQAYEIQYYASLN